MNTKTETRHLKPTSSTQCFLPDHLENLMEDGTTSVRRVLQNPSKHGSRLWALEVLLHIQHQSWIQFELTEPLKLVHRGGQTEQGVTLLLGLASLLWEEASWMDSQVAASAPEEFAGSGEDFSHGLLCIWRTVAGQQGARRVCGSRRGGLRESPWPRGKEESLEVQLLPLMQNHSF